MEELIRKFFEDKGCALEEGEFDEAREMANVMETELDNLAKESGLYEMIQAMDESDCSLLKDVLRCVIDYIFTKARKESIETAEVVDITKATEQES